MKLMLRLLMSRIPIFSISEFLFFLPSAELTVASANVKVTASTSLRYPLTRPPFTSLENCHTISAVSPHHIGGTNMAKPRKFSATRRNFLKGAAVAGAASLTPPITPSAGALYEHPGGRRPPLQDARAETAVPKEVDVLTTDHCGSDFMVDVLRSLDIEYVCANPGSSFRAL